MAVNFVNIPQEIKDNCPFCTWKFEKRKGEKKPTKVPYIPGTMERASTNDVSTFKDFPTAMKSYAMGGYDGIGIRVSNGIGAIDIDHCIREDGSLNDVAASILGLLPDAYFEKSPSGTGLRGFFKLDPDFAYDKTAYYINNRTLGLEVYIPGATNRFVTITGDVYREGTVSDDMDAVRSLLDTFMKRKTKADNKYIEPHSYLTDEQVVEHASNAPNGEKFRDFMDGKWQEYFDNQSDADMSFVSMLCFWCGNVEEQIDRIFRSSGMMRPKWDRMTGDATYGQITIRNAVASSPNIYLPANAQDIADAEHDFVDLDGDMSGNGQDGGRKRPSGREDKPVDFRPDISRIALTIEDMKPESNSRYGKDEIGVGYMFADYFRPIARYNSERKLWYIYDGVIWQPDIGNLKAAELAKLLADKLMIYGLDIREEDVRTRFLDRVKKLQKRKNRDTMLKDAMSVFPITMAAFDRDIYLFNCRNGTLNLRTFEFRGHDPADFITKKSDTVYDPSAACPRWVRFMDEVMQGDAERILFLQKALGYTLTGDTSLDCFFILYGPTSRNGKGTTMETFLRILGDYGRTSDPNLLAQKFNAQSSGPSEDLARLAGARCVNISELEKKLTINAALTKQLTGSGTVAARFLHENSFEFKPNFKIFIDTNHRPNITDLTLFESGRVKIIPFNRHFSEEEQDKTLKSQFAKPENMSGILNWLIEGYRLFTEQMLEMPESVREATDEYRQDSDRIAQFMAECIMKAKGDELRSKAVYDRYKDWCSENGFRYENKTNFKKRMAEEYVFERRRPWNEKNAGSTTMVNDVKWMPGEELDPDIVPD